MGVLVGAYERDNFGDLLFLLQTRHYLGPVSTVAASPVSAAMGHLLGDDIAAYRELLASEQEFLWTVGGEAGGTDLTAALDMSLTDSEAARLRGMSDAQRETWISAQIGAPSYALAYMPRPSRYPANYGTPFIINSIGASGVARLRGRARIEALATLQDADFISVRDIAGSRVLNRLGFHHDMAPDLVQTIALNHTPSRDPEPDVALVQIKARYLEEIGVSAFAKQITTAKSLKPFRIRLFSAGAARGHDSPELLARVADEVARHSSGDRISVSTAEMPWDKADELATCGLYVGTSLHGFIIASAFNVPRVGLEIAKLRTYASTWGDTMPTGAKLNELDQAIGSALTAHRSNDGEGFAIDLANRAEQSICKAMTIASAEDAHATSQRIDERRQRNEGVALALANADSLHARAADRWVHARGRARRVWEKSRDSIGSQS